MQISRPPAESRAAISAEAAAARRAIHINTESLISNASIASVNKTGLWRIPWRKKLLYLHIVFAFGKRHYRSSTLPKS